jgi:hypothetical protein
MQNEAENDFFLKILEELAVQKYSMYDTCSTYSRHTMSFGEGTKKESFLFLFYKNSENITI